jgi:hypothetical protein
MNVERSSLLATAKNKEFSIRLSPTLYRRIKSAAVAGGRTINGEIIGRLEASFDFQTVDEMLSTTASAIALQVEAVLIRYFNEEKKPNA